MISFDVDSFDYFFAIKTYVSYIHRFEINCRCNSNIFNIKFTQIIPSSQCGNFVTLNENKRINNDIMEQFRHFGILNLTKIEEMN